MYPGVGAFVLIRPAQTFYERIRVEFFMRRPQRWGYLAVTIALALGAVALFLFGRLALTYRPPSRRRRRPYV